MCGTLHDLREGHEVCERDARYSLCVDPCIVAWLELRSHREKSAVVRHVEAVGAVEDLEMCSCSKSRRATLHWLYVSNRLAFLPPGSVIPGSY